MGWLKGKTKIMLNGEKHIFILCVHYMGKLNKSDTINAFQWFYFDSICRSAVRHYTLLYCF